MKNSKDGSWTSNTPEASPSFSKGESKASPHVPTHDNKDNRILGRHKEVGTTPQSKIRRDTSSIWNQESKYENGFNCYLFFCNDFGHKALDCRPYEIRSVGNMNNTDSFWT